MQRKKLLTSLIGIIAVALVALAATFIAGNKPKLGLDLQGGASVVLRPNRKVDNATLDQTIKVIRSRVDALGVAEPEISRQGSDVLVELPGVKDQQKALNLVGQTAELRFRPVLGELAVATRPTTTTTLPKGATTLPKGATTTAVTTGSVTTGSGAGASTTGASSSLPLGGGAGSAIPLPRRLPAADTTTPTTTPSTATTSSATTVAGSATTVAGSATTVTASSPTTTAGSTLPTVTPREQDDPTKEVVLDEIDNKGNVVARYLLGPTAFTGDVINGASATIDPQSGGGLWQVSLQLKGGTNGIDKWNKLAAACYNGQPTCPVAASGLTHGQIAIVLDSVVKSAPQVNTPTFQADQISITGHFSESQARDLALVLKFGALPVQLTPQAVNTVSATLGKDSLRAGIVAGLVGLALVITFMLLYYRSLGLVVLLGLAVSASLLWSIIAWLGQVRGLALTLAGATGVIVSIGVTVDSYVVFFERLKDDVHAGKTLRTSAQRGFQSAYRTIIAADLVSLIGAAVLWYLTVGSVRGFAFFLGLSTLLDMVVAWFFTRPFVILLSRNDRMNRGRVLGLETVAVAGAGATR